MFVHVPRGEKIEKPIQIVWQIDEPGTAQYAQTLVVVDELAECEIREYFLAPDFEGQALHAGSFEMFVGQAANARVAHFQDWGAGEVHDISTRRIEIARDAHCSWVPIHLGGHLTKQRLDIVTAEQGSDMRHTGLYITQGDEHLDLYTTDLHEAGHTTGDTVWKGALTGESRASYEGLIHIVKDAQETDTYLQTHSMLLSPRAKGDSIPSLIVETDNVKASHGGTVGEIDEDQVFYMMSPRHPAPGRRAHPRRGLLRGGHRAPARPGARGARARAHRGEDRRGRGRRPGVRRPALMATTASLDVRADFPILRTTWRTSTRPRRRRSPRSVIQAIDHYYRTSNANMHRSVYELAEKATEAYEGARERVAEFVGWDSASTIFTKNVTEAINLVAYAWGRQNLKPGDEILVTEMEHHSNIVPWQIAAQQTGATLRWLHVQEDGTLSLDELDEELARGTIKLVAVAHISNVLGTINPVQEITARAHAAGALVLVDGAQAVPQMPVDVRRDRLRLLRLDRAQGARADRHRRAARAPRPARERCPRSSAAAR